VRGGGRSRLARISGVVPKWRGVDASPWKIRTATRRRDCEQQGGHYPPTIRPGGIGVETMSHVKAIPEACRDAVPREQPRAIVAAEPDPRPGRLGKVPVVRVPASKAESSGIAEAAYRVFEIALASIGLIVATPLMLAIAVLIRLDSPGPVLFRHRRPARSVRVHGRDLEGRTDLHPPPGGYDRDAQYYVPAYFTLVKFRTMYRDAPTRFPTYYPGAYAREDFRSQYPHVENDPRITRVGRLLRKLSVDELPNLLSVVVGDMRLVGPRPEALEVLQYHTPEEMIRFTCKPGITGLAQINGRKLLSWGETMALDLEYVRMRTIALDLKIILLTIKRVVTAHGAL
jgi:exopolysaccharide production protein ExoY